MQQDVSERGDSVCRGEFRGNAKEYFGIWIVNVLLTIVTVGIYSAWAKVRRNRYFYGNTFVADHSFDYHAKGKQIFIGRVIVFGLFIAINILTTIVPPLAFVFPLIILAVLPWLISRGLRFSARVTSYRNVRFDFVGKPWGAFVSVILGGLVAFISLGILAPFASRWLYRYIFNNLRYGDRAFSLEIAVGRIYAVWILPALMALLGAVIVSVVGGVIYVAGAQGLPEDPGEEALVALMIAGIYGFLILGFIVYAVISIFYKIGVRNVVMSATLLDGRHQLFSDMGRMRYFWIVLSNLVVTILTLGLMRPWAAVREHRYKVENAGITIHGDIGEIVTSMQASGAAATAEYLDMEGFDFGF